MVVPRASALIIPDRELDAVELGERRERITALGSADGNLRASFVPLVGDREPGDDDLGWFFFSFCGHGFLWFGYPGLAPEKIYDPEENFEKEQ
jgi:hypothetical protein